MSFLSAWFPIFFFSISYEFFSASWEISSIFTSKTTIAILTSGIICLISKIFVDVLSPSRVQLFVTPWIATQQASLSLIISQSLIKFMFIESVMLSNHLILCHPLLLLPSIVSQHQGLFQWVGSSHQVAKILKLQQQSFNEHSGLISAASVLLLKF